MLISVRWFVTPNAGACGVRWKSPISHHFLSAFHGGQLCWLGRERGSGPAPWALAELWLSSVLTCGRKHTGEWADTSYGGEDKPARRDRVWGEDALAVSRLRSLRGAEEGWGLARRYGGGVRSRRKVRLRSCRRPGAQRGAGAARGDAEAGRGRQGALMGDGVKWGEAAGKERVCSLLEAG